MRQFLKISGLLFVLCLLIGFVVLLTLYLHGDLYRQAQSVLVKIVEQNLDAQIEIDRMSGSILRTVQLDNIRLFRGADTLLQVDTLRCHWRPITLLWGRITLSQIDLARPRIALRQLDDGKWNYEQYIRSSTDSTGSRWSVNLRSINLHESSLLLQTAKDSSKAAAAGPLLLQIPSLSASVWIAPKRWRIEIKDASADLAPLGLAMARLKLKARGDAGSFDLSDLHFETGATRIRGSLEARLKPELSFSTAVRLDSLDAAELKSFTRQTMPFNKARIELLATGNLDSINVNLTAGAPAGRLLLRGWIKPAGEAAGILDIIDLQTDSLLSRPGNLNATLNFSGKGFSLEEGQWRIQGRLHHPLLECVALQEAAFSAVLAQKQLSVNLSAPGINGSLAAIGLMRLEENPLYDLNLIVSGLNLAPLIDQPSLPSRLNLDLHLIGQGMTESSARGQAWLFCHPSTIAGFAIDSLYAASHLRFSSINIDTLQLQAPGLKGAASASWRNHGPIAISFRADLREHRAFATWMRADSLRLNGAVQGTVSGENDSLRLDTVIKLHESTYDNLTFKSLQAIIRATRSGRPAAEWRLVSGPIRSGRKGLIDSLHIQGALAGSEVSAGGAITFGDSLATRFSMKAQSQDSLWQIILPQLEVHHRQQIWRLENEPPRILLGSNRIALSGLALVQGKQRLALNGHLDMADSIFLSLDLENMDVGQWAGLFPGSPVLAGAMTWRSTLSGSASSPHIVSSMQAEKLTLAGLPLATMQLSGTYQDSVLIWQGGLTQSPNNSLSFSGLLPLRLRWPLPKALILPSDSVTIAVTTQDLQIGILSAFVSNLDLKGTLSGDLTLKNTWQDIKPGGYLQLRKGSLQAPYLGKPYKQIEARLELEPSRLVLNSLSIAGGDGYLRGDGFWHFDLDQKGLRFKEMLLRLKTDNFTAADGQELTLVLDGTVELADKLAQPKLNGALRVVRARIDLPSITETPSTMMQADQPLLLVTRDDTSSQSYDRKILLPGWMPFVERLRGSVKIEIPRNTWLRSPEMNIEIAGDLDLAKDGENFGLFGSIRIARGNYDLFGRRFDIQEGTLTFTGGDNLPQMQLEANHVFRSQDKTKHTLTLTATGELRKPTLSFKLDDTEIADTDAVSYLAFGRSFGELTHGEKSNLAQNQLQMSGDAVKQLLAGQIAGEVTRSIQQTLDLDVIEFRGDQNWRQATVVVGKYLTNDLYMSYERQLNLGRTNEVVPEQVTLEYEVMRSLFLQATKGDEKNTGFDLIWKWEK